MTAWQSEFFESFDKPFTVSGLRRIFLLLMRFHFSDSNNYGDLREILKTMVWTDTEETTAMDVELMGVFNPSVLIRRPAVYVGFRNMKFSKKVIADYAGQSVDTATRYLVKAVDTQLVVRSVAADEDMVSAMSDTVLAFLFGMRDMLFCKLQPQLMAMDIAEMTDPEIVEKSPERRFQCDVLTSLSFNYMINTNLESHPVKKVALEWTATR